MGVADGARFLHTAFFATCGDKVGDAEDADESSAESSELDIDFLRETHAASCVQGEVARSVSMQAAGRLPMLLL